MSLWPQHTLDWITAFFSIRLVDNMYKAEKTMCRQTRAKVSHINYKKRSSLEKKRGGGCNNYICKRSVQTGVNGTCSSILNESQRGEGVKRRLAIVV